MRHIFRAREAGAVVVSRWRRGFFIWPRILRREVLLCGKEVVFVETRVALMGIIVEEPERAAEVNELLHRYSEYVIGRMGVPYRARGVNIISVVLDAPQDVISALSGRMGRLEGVSAKTLYSNVITPIEDR